MTDLNIVVPYSFKAESGEMIDGKSFHVVTLWGPMAGIAERFVKAGSQVFLSGRLQTDTWEDEKTGEKRSKTKIVALDLILLDPKDGQLPSPTGASSITGALNRADIVGHVTRDPELRTTTGGQQVLTLGVATNDKWKDKASGQDRERAEYHNVVVWGDLAKEVSAHIHKGNRVFVSGRVQTRSWETKDGSKRYTTEVIADTVHLLGVRSAVAEAAVRMEGPVSSSINDLPPRSSAKEDIPSVPEPEIAYASEIKAEDLPF